MLTDLANLSNVSMMKRRAWNVDTKGEKNILINSDYYFRKIERFKITETMVWLSPKIQSWNQILDRQFSHIIKEILRIHLKMIRCFLSMSNLGQT